MLTHVHIKNFKCLRDVAVDLDPLTVLIGPNDSGKSSFLQAVRHALQAHRGGQKDAEWVWTFDEREERPSSWPFQVYRFSPHELRKAVSIEQAQLRETGEGLPAVLDAIMTGPDREALVCIERDLRRCVPTFKGLSLVSVGSRGYKELRFVLAGDEKPPLTISADAASEGALLLTAYLALAYGESPSVLLIEEPENGLHPERLGFVVDLLKKISTGELGGRPRQVILTTHSPLLLNHVAPENVRVFLPRQQDEGARVYNMKDVPNLEQLSRHYGPGQLWHLVGEEGLAPDAAKRTAPTTSTNTNGQPTHAAEAKPKDSSKRTRSAKGLSKTASRRAR